jgi:hypothetical protein
MNLNAPGSYVHWWIFEASVANLTLICVMIVIFGAALLLPFPGSRRRGRLHASSQLHVDAPADSALTEPDVGPTDTEETSVMWTARLRRQMSRHLPYDKLIPDRQPAYVASWIYVFGAASLAALSVVIASGCALALGGPDWWHDTSVGHFFNSLHLWSVELFMAFLVIHLWGKFWMAAWRGKRALTWVTGVVAFLAAVVECFTGYLSQQNFDSQWISTSGKDAFDAVGVGAFFNVMNFGQMLMWHIVLIPVLLFTLIGAHVLLVRIRGVSHPLPSRPARGKVARRAQAQRDAAEWKGPWRRYDILKEGTVATAIVLVLSIVLAGVLSSPDVPPLTVRSWAQVAPADFMATAASELAGTSETATYGPPYNHGSGSVQTLGPHWQMLVGVRQPINAAQTFVLSPLRKLAPSDLPLQRALSIYATATGATRATWNENYAAAVEKVTFYGGVPSVPRTDDGSIPVLIASELTLARSGALDADLLAQQPFYGTNYTKPLLFLEDGNYFSAIATSQHLGGGQWGVMNETGSYPGQPWLWLYTLWYQVPGFSSSANVDLIAVYLTGLATVLLLAVPFIPGLRDVPSVVPVHRLIWRKGVRAKPEE